MSRAYRGSVGPQQAFTNNLGVGAGIGAAAFVVNYVVTYLFVVIDGADSGDEVWKLVGQLLYNAQFVSTEISSGGSSTTYNMLDEVSGSSDLTSTIPAIGYRIVPILVLVLAGIVVVQQASSRLETQSAAAVGASILPGYLVLALLGTFLFEISTTTTTNPFSGASTTTTAAPEMVPAIAIVGVALPLVLGAIGGAISNEL
jgi:hypothetical protein